MVRVSQIEPVLYCFLGFWWVAFVRLPRRPLEGFCLSSRNHPYHTWEVAIMRQSPAIRHQLKNLSRSRTPFKRDDILQASWCLPLRLECTLAHDGLFETWASCLPGTKVWTKLPYRLRLRFDEWCLNAFLVFQYLWHSYNWFVDIFMLFKSIHLMRWSRASLQRMNRSSFLGEPNTEGEVVFSCKVWKALSSSLPNFARIFSCKLHSLAVNRHAMRANIETNRRNILHKV